MCQTWSEIKAAPADKKPSYQQQQYVGGIYMLCNAVELTLKIYPEVLNETFVVTSH